jgi:Tfp pilus assembly protein PilE
MKSKKNGITLIALIITIIVLLILAGVTISALIGENGVLTRAQNASDETKISSVQEEIELAWTGRVTAYYEGIANGSKLTKESYFSEEEMSKELAEGTISDYSYEEADTTFVYTMNSTGEKYGVSIDNGGKVSISEVYIKIIIRTGIQK